MIFFYFLMHTHNTMCAKKSAQVKIPCEKDLTIKKM